MPRRTRSPSCDSPAAKDVRDCCETTQRAARSCSNVSAGRCTSSRFRFANGTRSSARPRRAFGDPAPESGLPTGAEKGRWLVDFISATWEELDRPCSERAIDYALTCAKRRIDAHRDERAVLVHGDVHEWNALEAPNGFKLVDPDGLLAEPEYDLGIIMREDPVDLLDGDPHERARWLAARTGLDVTSIWDWGVVERVSTGLLGTKVGLQPVARQMLAAADTVCRRVDTAPA